MARRFVGTPHLFYPGVIVAAAPTFVFNWDLIEKLAQLDTRHAGWFIDETVTLVAILGIAVTFRRTTLLRWEVLRRQAAESEAASLARHDPLTGLPNRRLLQEVITEAIDSLPAGGSRAALMVDLDGFKAVNDLHGHPFGDALLCAVVERLASLMNEGTSLGRLGGDEFAVLLQANLTREAVGQVAERIVTCLAEPFRLADGLVRIGASVGIAFAPADGAATSALLRAADVALYRAKAAGRGAYRFFEPDMDRSTREPATPKAELRHAVVTREIAPRDGSTFDPLRGAVDGLAVARRWRNPWHGFVGPDMFVPLAEDLHLSSAPGLSPYEKISRDARQWPNDDRIAIRVSPAELEHPRIYKRLVALIAQADLEPSRFELESTETALTRDIGTASEVISALAALGPSVVVDDFGAGYASLYRLPEAAVEKVKIGGSFLRAIAANPMAGRHMDAVIRLALSLGLKMGVEDADTPVLDGLAGLGCTLGRGCLFSRPIAAADVNAALARLAARHSAAVSAAWRSSA